MTSATRRLPFVLYGSCVSRDTFEFALRGRADLLRYVARQSLISAFSPPVLGLEPRYELLDHDFQRRVLRDDLESSFSTLLPTLPARPLIVLWDLVDERLGVYRFDDGTIVTRSLELMRCGLDASLDRRADLLPFGSDEHLTAWSASLERFRTQLATLDGQVVVVAIDVPWSDHDDTGRQTPPSFQMSAADANGHSARYFDVLRSRPGIDVVTVPAAEVTSDSAHRWGAAPFHYDRPTYAAISSRVMKLVEDRLLPDPQRATVEGTHLSAAPAGRRRPITS